MNFETFMDTLCIELGLPLNSDFDTIVAGVRQRKRKRKKLTPTGLTVVRPMDKVLSGGR